MSADQRRLVSEDSYKLARLSLITGFHCGIPYFSAGITWLLEGLTVLLDEDDQKKGLTKVVHNVALRHDPSLAFTVIHLNKRRRQSEPLSR